MKVNGLDVEKEKKKLAEIIGYLPQHPAFYEYMTGKEWMQWVGQLFHLNKKTIEERTENLLTGLWNMGGKQSENFRL